MTSSEAPYAGRPESEWAEITRHVVATHPLGLCDLREVVLAAWGHLWSIRLTTSAGETGLGELGTVPAQVVSYLLEQLIGLELTHRHPKRWRRGATGEDKDLVYTADTRFSVEVKCSGQKGDQIYGNRSYAQVGQSTKKSKSGYYLTINFHERDLFLIRFGWVDESDWRGQDAPTGQMASLSRAVYDFKLLPIPGEYRANAPVCVLPGVGRKTADPLHAQGIVTIRDLLAWPDCPDELRTRASDWLARAQCSP